MCTRCRNCIRSSRDVNERIVEISGRNWRAPGCDPKWIEAVEDGKVLYFPQLAFELSDEERTLLQPELLAEGVRNISWDTQRGLKGVAGGEGAQRIVEALMSRFVSQATSLVPQRF